MKGKYIILSILMAIAVVFVMIFVFVPKLSVGLIQTECPDCDVTSAIQIASQLGRLDVVSMALGFLGVGVGFFAIFSFFAVKDEAEEKARTVAEKYYSDKWLEISEKIDDQVSVKVKAAIAELQIKYQVSNVDVSGRTEVKTDE